MSGYMAVVLLGIALGVGITLIHRLIRPMVEYRVVHVATQQGHKTYRTRLVNGVEVERRWLSSGNGSNAFFRGSNHTYQKEVR